MEHNRSLGRIDSVCQVPVFGGRRRPDIRFLGLQRMIDALIVHLVLKIPDTQGCSFYFTVLLFHFSPLQLLEEDKGDWQSSKSKSINRHVSRNGAVTIHCSPLEHVEDMNSWYQIHSIAPDECDAIDLAELGRLTRQ